MQKKYKIIIIKIGTAVLTKAGGGLNVNVIRGICRQIAKLTVSGYKIVVVSSGAIGAGLKLANAKQRPQKLSKLQAAAAIGQSKLMRLYEDCLHKHNLHAAQILLTQEDLRQRIRYVNAANTIYELFESYSAIPIINENDTVATDEIKFGDNDRLCVLVAGLVNAEQIIFLTSVDGLTSPETGRVLRLVTKIDNSIMGMATKDVGVFAIGGMQSKLKAVKSAVLSGISCVIANGKQKNVILKIINNEATGTVFVGQKQVHSAKKRWIKFCPKTKGSIIVDIGAKKALLERGKSLLASGIKGIEGDFIASDVVIIKDTNGSEFAGGVVNFSARELEKIAGVKTSDLHKILKRKVVHEEVIHRNNMVVL